MQLQGFFKDVKGCQTSNSFGSASTHINDSKKESISSVHFFWFSGGVVLRPKTRQKHLQKLYKWLQCYLNPTPCHLFQNQQEKCQFWFQAISSCLQVSYKQKGFIHARHRISESSSQLVGHPLFNSYQAGDIPFGSNVKTGSGVFPGEGGRHKGRSDPKKISDQQRSRVHGIFSLLNVGFRWKVWRKCSHPGIFQDIWFLLSWSLKGFRRKILKKLTSTMRVIFADGCHSVESDKLLGVKEVTWEYAYRNQWLSDIPSGLS